MTDTTSTKQVVHSATLWIPKGMKTAVSIAVALLRNSKQTV